MQVTCTFNFISFAIPIPLGSWEHSLIWCFICIPSYLANSWHGLECFKNKALLVRFTKLVILAGNIWSHSRLPSHQAKSGCNVYNIVLYYHKITLSSYCQMLFSKKLWCFHYTCSLENVSKFYSPRTFSGQWKYRTQKWHIFILTATDKSFWKIEPKIIILLWPGIFKKHVIFTEWGITFMRFVKG